mmetsp:Transcript_16722/g.42876  ORF Transcript_16722/g.42876 Transcript_16722/m.42876 type:complete len:379 (+) Transcript_16722:581-1717(+)
MRMLSSHSVLRTSRIEPGASRWISAPGLAPVRRPSSCAEGHSRNCGSSLKSISSSLISSSRQPNALRQRYHISICDSLPVAHARTVTVPPTKNTGNVLGPCTLRCLAFFCARCLSPTLNTDRMRKVECGSRTCDRRLSSPVLGRDCRIARRPLELALRKFPAFCFVASLAMLGLRRFSLAAYTDSEGSTSMRIGGTKFGSGVFRRPCSGSKLLNSTEPLERRTVRTAPELLASAEMLFLLMVLLRLAGALPRPGEAPVAADARLFLLRVLLRAASAVCRSEGSPVALLLFEGRPSLLIRLIGRLLVELPALEVAFDCLRAPSTLCLDNLSECSLVLRLPLLSCWAVRRRIGRLGLGGPSSIAVCSRRCRSSIESSRFL